MIIGDIESNGLLDTATKIHCAVFYDTETNVYTEFTPENMVALKGYIQSLPAVSGHNALGFDIPLLEKVAGIVYTGVVFDTLLVSRLLFPDLEAPKYYDEAGREKTVKNAHSVEAYGVRFGIQKPVHEDWSTFSPEMLHRCREDVKIQTKIYEYLQEHIANLQMRDRRVFNMTRVIEMEHQVCRIIEQQARNGWQFNLELAYKLIDQLSDIIQTTEDKLQPLLPISVVKVGAEICKAFTASGVISANAAKWVKDVAQIGGDFCKVKFELMNINSDAQLKTYLLAQGWQPSTWNFKKDKHNKPIRGDNGKPIKTSPKLPTSTEEWDEVAQLVQIPSINLLVEYNKATHRRSQIQGFIDNLRSDHRIEAQANTCATNTARMTHRIIVNVPKADPKVYYGHEMRSLFVASPGWVLVGCDASALEARCEAHYTYPFDRAAAMELLDGDIHTSNARLFGVDRNKAKSGKYAILYGCSPSKLAQTLGKPMGMAQRIYDDYWDGNPGLKRLKEALESAHKQWGYIIAIDGRPLTVRYNHALLNTLLQSCGSIIMKCALVILNEKLLASGKLFRFVGNFHDEMQLECKPEDAPAIGALMVRSIVQAGEYYNLNVPMAAEYKIGKTWAETH